MDDLTPEQLKHALHDPKESTKAATKARMQRFRDEAQRTANEPLSDDELQRRAQHLLTAHMLALSLKSSRSRSQKKKTKSKSITSDRRDG